MNEDSYVEQRQRSSLLVRGSRIFQFSDRNEQSESNIRWRVSGDYGYSWRVWARRFAERTAAQVWEHAITIGWVILAYLIALNLCKSGG